MKTASAPATRPTRKPQTSTATKPKVTPTPAVTTPTEDPVTAALAKKEASRREGNAMIQSLGLTPVDDPALLPVPVSAEVNLPPVPPTVRVEGVDDAVLSAPGAPHATPSISPAHVRPDFLVSPEAAAEGLGGNPPKKDGKKKDAPEKSESEKNTPKPKDHWGKVGVAILVLVVGLVGWIFWPTNKVSEESQLTALQKRVLELENKRPITVDDLISSDQFQRVIFGVFDKKIAEATAAKTDISKVIADPRVTLAIEKIVAAKIEAAKPLIAARAVDILQNEAVKMSVKTDDGTIVPAITRPEVVDGELKIFVDALEEVPTSDQQ